MARPYPAIVVVPRNPAFDLNPRILAIIGSIALIFVPLVALFRPFVRGRALIEVKISQLTRLNESNYLLR